MSHRVDLSRYESQEEHPGLDIFCLQATGDRRLEYSL